MYFHLNDIKNLADLVRLEKLRSELGGKLKKYRLGPFEQDYRSLLQANLSKLSLAYLASIAPHFNGQPPSIDAWHKIRDDLHSTCASIYAPHKLSLEDLAKSWLDTVSFDTLEVSSFICKYANRYRSEQLAGLNDATPSKLKVCIKVEETVRTVYQDGVYFFEALNRRANKSITTHTERLRATAVATALRSMERAYQETVQELTRLRYELAIYEPRPTPPPRKLKTP